MAGFLERSAPLVLYATPSAAKRGLYGALRSHKDRSKVEPRKWKREVSKRQAYSPHGKAHTLSPLPRDLGHQTGWVFR